MNPWHEALDAPEYQEFRDACRKVVYEARKHNLDPYFVYMGVAWSLESHKDSWMKKLVDRVVHKVTADLKP